MTMVTASSRSDDCEIRYEESTQTSFELVQLSASSPIQVRTFTVGQDAGGSIRTRKAGGRGFVSFNALSQMPHMMRMADLQAELLEDQSAPLPEPNGSGAINDQPAVLGDQLTIEAALQWAHRWNHLAFTLDRRIAAIQINVKQELRHLHFAANRQPYRQRAAAEVFVQFVAQAIDQARVTIGFESNAVQGPYDQPQSQEWVIETACRRALHALEAKPVSAGRYPVVLDPSLAGVFIHEAIGHLSEAD